MTTIRIKLAHPTKNGVDVPAPVWLEVMKDEDGNFLDPLGTAGQAAADALRQGKPPADLI